jgi:His/Glu/Gln/Arg/opine family amino acid ABC transporter permease subunit
MDFTLVFPYLQFLGAGAWFTVVISVFAMGLGLVLGLLAAVAKLTGIKPLVWMVDFYVWVIRGTPVLVQLFLIYFGLPQLGIEISAFMASILGLGVNAGAYVAEIFRGGIQAVAKGQREAASSLGMAHSKVLWRIVLPQALRISIPALGNQTVSMIKDSSLASLVTVSELMMVAQRFAASNFAFMEFYITVALIYLGLTTVASLLLNRFEKRMAVSEL